MPPSIENGSFELLGEGYFEGALIQYSCVVGFTLDGQALSRCNLERWSAAPRCVTDPTFVPGK